MRFVYARGLDAAVQHIIHSGDVVHITNLLQILKETVEKKVKTIREDKQKKNKETQKREQTCALKQT